MDIFVINLSSAIKRRQFQEQQLSKLKLDYQITNATTISDINNKTYQKHYYDWQRPMQKTEVACYFSHQTLWSKIVKKNRMALILEDDVLLSKHTPNILAKLEKYTNFDMVNLEVFNRKKYVAKKSQPIGHHQLFYLYQDKAGAAAYVLYPNGAKKLLQQQQKNGIALADAHLHNCLELQSYQIEPACAVQLMFCKKYDIKQYSTAISQSFIKYENNNKNHVFVFKIKRITVQIKLGIHQLSFILKAKKRYIKLNNKDFK